LVSPVKNFSGGHFVLLSSLDISVIQHDQVFNLGIHKYLGNQFDPKGHKYLVSFDFESVPTLTYRIGGVVLTVEYVLAEMEEQFFCKVTLKEAHSDTKLRFKPFLAFRSIHELTCQNMVADTRVKWIDQGVGLKMYEGFPTLNLQCSKPSEFIPVPDWYRGIEYLKDQNRGFPFKEDLFVPGYFEMDIKKGESIVMSAATFVGKPGGFKGKFSREFKKRRPRFSLLDNLLNSANQFLMFDGSQPRLLAGYHWYGERLRDSLLSLPGLAAYQDDRTVHREIMGGVVKQIRKEFLASKGALSPGSLRNIDVPLWFFWTIGECASQCDDFNVWEDYGSFMLEILQYYQRGKNGFERMDASGLLYAKVEGQPLTWMDAIVDGQPVTWRPGFTVELNALWYNALMFYSQLALENGEEAQSKIYSELAEKVKEAFVHIFWNETDKCLFDYVDHDYKSHSIRPNQIFAAALPYSPLSPEECKAVIDIVKKELLSPRGLRTLSPQDVKYKGVVEGSQRERDLALHQGAAFPWLSPFFAEAYLKIHKQGGLPFVKKMVEGFEEEMGDHCIGTISEYYNGNPPHTGKGAVSMCWNVAGVLRLLKLIDKYISI
jgi:glycogen debranching enzyme